MINVFDGYWDWLLGLDDGFLLWWQQVQFGSWLIALNPFIPYIGLGCVLLAVFTSRINTKSLAISSIMHLYIFAIIMLIWADNTSGSYEPSRQSVMARLIMLAIIILTVIFVHCVQKPLRQMAQIKAQNEHLKKVNQAMIGQLERLKSLKIAQIRQENIQVIQVDEQGDEQGGSKNDKSPSKHIRREFQKSIKAKRKHKRKQPWKTPHSLSIKERL